MDKSTRIALAVRDASLKGRFDAYVKGSWVLIWHCEIRKNNTSSRFVRWMLGLTRYQLEELRSFLYPVSDVIEWAVVSDWFADNGGLRQWRHLIGMSVPHDGDRLMFVDGCGRKVRLRFNQYCYFQ